MPFPINEDFQIECPQCKHNNFMVTFNKYRSIVSCQNCPYVEVHESKTLDVDPEAVAKQVQEYQLPEGLYF